MSDKPTGRDPQVVKEHLPTMFRNGRIQRRCWAATTADGAWRIERQDDVNTAWIIFRTDDSAEGPPGSERWPALSQPSPTATPPAA